MHGDSLEHIYYQVPVNEEAVSELGIYFMYTYVTRHSDAGINKSYTNPVGTESDLFPGIRMPGYIFLKNTSVGATHPWLPF